MNTTEAAAGLRAWAAGSHATEAAVELLIRAADGRLLEGPWIARSSTGRIWFDTAAATETDYLSSGQQRILAIAASLTDEQASVVLAEVLPGLERDVVELVLAAIAHTAGTHEHADIEIIDGAMHNHGQLPSLYPWPATPSPLRLVRQDDDDADT